MIWQKSRSLHVQHEINLFESALRTKVNPQ